MKLVAVVILLVVIAGIAVKCGLDRPDLPAPASTTASVLTQAGAAAKASASRAPAPVARASQLPAASDELAGLALSTSVTPIERLSEAGQSKAAAAVQSYLTAAKQQNVNRLAQLVDYAELLPNETRRQYEAIAKDLLAELAKEGASITSVQVLSREEIGPIDQLIRVRVAHADGSLKDEQFLMHCGGLGWQRDISVQSELFLQRRR